MAAPLSERAFAKIVGLEQARAQMRQLPEWARVQWWDVTATTAAAIVGRARAAAPVRREDLPDGYSGGALKQHIAWEQKPSDTAARIGIEMVALVVRTRGRRGAGVTTYHDHKFKRARDGKWRRRTLSRQASARLRAGGAKVIRPTKYGHLQEFGAPQHRAQPFMRPAAQAEQMAFEQRARKAQAEVERLLAAAGYRG